MPGIEPSGDRILQGRMFSHTDTQMYRLGANFNQPPINRPRVRVTNNNQDGALNFGDRKGEANYESSTLNELAQNPRDKSEQRCRSPRCSAASTCCRYSSHMARTRITSMRSVVPRYRT
ncbi:catalase domain protein [Burkholderia cenocepacia BC7]|nr:catalase domain protein [Burkholderia cenocepacia K56-2Valvano]ERI26397.1 catalase domain protein [Burkholderia cenocepacia BC7]KKI83510.1 lipoprotein [Burkholderia cenocepacia]